MIAQPIQTKQLSADGYTWNQYSPQVATITNELTHFATVAYFAFDEWNQAHAFWKSITDKQVCSRALLRESERFTSYRWEVKTWGMSEQLLTALIKRDRNRQPQVRPLPPVRRDWSVSESHDAIAIEAA